MKFILFIPIGLWIFLSCKDTVDAPVIGSDSIDYKTQTQNTIDEGRLCLAELFAYALEDLDFRRFIKSQSFHDYSNLNREILLIELWNKALTADLSFQGLLDKTLYRHSNTCYSSLDEIKATLFDDPLLVLKLPDLIYPNAWNESEIIPVLYVNTIQPVSNSPGSGNGSYVGFHSSGYIDRYFTEVPDFFPLVLKQSDDYVLFDKDLNLYAGRPITEYHDWDQSQSISEEIFSHKIIIQGQEYYLYPLNEFIKELNLSGDNHQPPFKLDSCTEQCPYACIPEDERKLTAQQVVVHRQNNLAKDYEFTSVYRWGSHMILEDNVTLLIITQHIDFSGGGIWKKRLMGTFRVNTLFNAVGTITARNRVYNFNNTLIKLPEMTLTYSLGKNAGISAASLVLAEDIRNNDILRFSSYRIKIDRLGSEVDLLNGEVILATYFSRDVVQNYDLYCIMRNDTLGFNSLSIVCDF